MWVGGFQVPAAERSDMNNREIAEKIVEGSTWPTAELGDRFTGAIERALDEKDSRIGVHSCNQGVIDNLQAELDRARAEIADKTNLINQYLLVLSKGEEYSAEKIAALERENRALDALHLNAYNRLGELEKELAEQKNYIEITLANLVNWQDRAMRAEANLAEEREKAKRIICTKCNFSAPVYPDDETEVLAAHYRVCPARDKA